MRTRFSAGLRARAQLNETNSEARYLVLNAIANQLRFPNSHTHFFSCVLLALFMDTKAEAAREQITRVLLERLIVNRPHPWVRARALARKKASGCGGTCSVLCARAMVWPAAASSAPPHKHSQAGCHHAHALCMRCVEHACACARTNQGALCFCPTPSRAHHEPWILSGRHWFLHHQLPLSLLRRQETFNNCIPYLNARMLRACSSLLSSLSRTLATTSGCTTSRAARPTLSACSRAWLPPVWPAAAGPQVGFGTGHRAQGAWGARGIGRKGLYNWGTCAGGASMARVGAHAWEGHEGEGSGELRTPQGAWGAGEWGIAHSSWCTE